MENSKIREDIIENLRQVYDPEISVNVYDLGLIYEININGEKLTLKSRINHKKPLEMLNAFLILLDDSEFLNFDAIDLNKINTFENDSEDQLYEFNIQSKISNKFADINQKYLDELGSLGLSNRIKNLDKIFENNI